MKGEGGRKEKEGLKYERRVKDEKCFNSEKT